MSTASRPASRWAVSARTNGEVLTAGIARSELELTVLGLPGGFSQLEIEGWLHDLAGVAVETSRADSRARAIPALLHHALTGLLFSHAELWDRLEPPRPCSSAFVDLPDGAAFGWVGEARVHVLVDGDPVEPQWVRVRDDEGREARAAVFAPGRDVVVTLEYWPEGEGSGAAPASLEAEWVDSTDAAGQAQAWAAEDAPLAGPAAEVTPAWFASAAVETSGVQPPLAAPMEPAPVTEFEPVGEPGPGAAAPTPFAREPYPDLPESLPVQQPGLAPSALDLQREASVVPELVVPIARAPEVSWADHDAPDSASLASEPAPEPASAPASLDDAPAGEPAEHRPPHPVARWLARVMNWGRPERRDARPGPVTVEPEGAPVSAYDSLLSESVPATSQEQTALELPASDPANVAPARPLAGPAPGTLRTAGIAEILGAHAAATPAPADAATPTQSSAPAAAFPAGSPSGSIAINEKLQALLREIEAAEAGPLPVLSPEVPEESARRPLEIDHEPVGADEGFGIPPLPPSSTTAPPEEDRVSSIPPLPASRAGVYPPPPRPSSAPAPSLAASDSPAVTPAPTVATAPADVDPPAAAVSAPVTQPVESVPAAPPVLRVALPSRANAAPGSVPARAVTPEPLAPASLDRYAAPAPVAPEGIEMNIAPEPIVMNIAPEPIGLHAASEPIELPAGSPAAAEAAPDLEPLFPRVTRRARSLEGPESFERPRPRLPRGAWLWAAGVVAVFVLGWLVGGLANPGADRGGPVMAALRAIGLGGAHFTLNVNSSPGGAQIEIDGKAHSSRTPATLELPPGDHVVRLMMPGLGAVEVPVKGRGGEKVSIDEPLNGSLEILAADSKVPITVSIDGKPAGYAPLKVESIAPGLHEVGFSGPGMPAWAQTVQVEVRGAAQLLARPMSAPANGVLQAQATINDERGASPLSGAQVFVDGELRGVTPLSIELPRGPHSLRVTWRGETAPVQVIDLPGGNQRFAAFNFGLDAESARLTPIGSTRSFASNQPKVVSAAVEGLSANDVNEAWLHVRTPEGLWRRYAMTVLGGAGGLVVTSVFPDNVFDKQGNTRWYVRVITHQGDETFSEVQRSVLVHPAAGTSSRQQP